MSNDLVAFERDLNFMAPQLAEAIPPAAKLPVERMIRTIVISCERNKALLECNRQTVINAAWTVATLGLECDGVTGQAYLIPRNVKGQKIAQVQIGFKGLETIAARAGFIMVGSVIREGDEWLVADDGSGVVKVRKDLGGKGRIIGAFANALSNHFPGIGELLTLDDIERIRATSEATYNGRPWEKWYDQMCIKSAKKRLSKSMPMIDLHRAVALDDAAEIGRAVYLRQDGNLVDSDGREQAIEGEVYPQRAAAVASLPEPPRLYLVAGNGKEHDSKTPSEWLAMAMNWIDQMPPGAVPMFRKNNEAAIDAAREMFAPEVAMIETALDEKASGQ